MRLRRLNLTRYGHFNNVSLDFGAGNGESDLHIIYGPNEAGKSTAFEAYLDLLYGISNRSAYGFLHGYDNMAVGAELDLDDETIALTRIKKSKNNLLDTDGHPTNGLQLQRALMGIDRGMYRSMFSLDDETIEAGGEDILASRGSLGELLFSAAAGLTDLGEVLENVRAKTEAFHKARARKTYLVDAKKALEGLKSEIRDLDVQASAYRALRADRDKAKERFHQSKAVRDAGLSEQNHLKAVLDCLPLLPKLDDAYQELNRQDEAPDVTDDALEEALELEKTRITAETNKRNAAAKIEALNSKRTALTLDPAILGVEEELLRLLDTPRSRTQTAEEDLPRRHAEAETLRGELAQLAHDLGLQDAENVAFTEIDLNKLETLADDWMSAATANDLAVDELDGARDRLAELESDPPSEAVPLLSHTTLGTRLEEMDPETLLANAVATKDALADADKALQEALRGLSPVVAQPDRLDQIKLTLEEANRIAEGWSKLSDAVETSRKEFQAAELKAAEAASRLTGAESDERLSIEHNEQETRRERDAAWEVHHDTLTPTSAEDFHRLLLECDGYQDARLGIAEQIAMVRELKRASEEAFARQETLRTQLARAESELTKFRKQVSERLAAWGLPDSYDPRDLPSWCDRLLRAKSAHIEWDTKRIRHEASHRHLSEAEIELKKMLGITEDLTADAIVRKSRQKVAEATERTANAKARRESLEDAQKALRLRQEAQERSHAKLVTVKREWARLSDILPPSVIAPSDLKAALPTMRTLLARHKEHTQLGQRMSAMMRDVEAFSDAIGSLATRLDMEPQVNPLPAADALKMRLDKARAARDAAAALALETEQEMTRLDDSENTLQGIFVRVSECAAIFGPGKTIQTPGELRHALEAAKGVAALSNTVKDLEQRILSRLGTSSIEEALADLRTKDSVEMRATLEALESDQVEIETAYREAFGDLRTSENALEDVGGDERVARLEEEKETLLLSIAEEAHKIAAMRAGLLAAESSIAKYREAHRSSMLADTAAAFRTLTNGAYIDLSTQTDGAKETLLALRQRDGRSVSATDMSKGTRFQLYLALRLAGYRQYSESGPPLPFVADDIMETFDNTRTRAALSLLQEIGRKGQALYFTHHRHVVDLAKEVCGDAVSVQELGTQPQDQAAVLAVE